MKIVFVVFLFVTHFFQFIGERLGTPGQLISFVCQARRFEDGDGAGR